jgi:hypothetical protein
MTALFGGVYAASTLGSFLRFFTWGHALQLEAAARDLLIALAAATPLLPGPAGAEEVGAVEVAAVAVGAAGGARVDVAHRVLDVFEGRAAFPGGGGEGVAQRVRGQPPGGAQAGRGGHPAEADEDVGFGEPARVAVGAGGGEQRPGELSHGDARAGSAGGDVVVEVGAGRASDLAGIGVPTASAGASRWLTLPAVVATTALRRSSSP